MWDSLISTLKGIMALPSDANKSIAVAGVIWTEVTNYRLWRSIGWLLLGILITWIGLAIWNRRAIGSAAKTAFEAG